MNEIKFRAWDKVDKEMKRVFALDFAEWWVATDCYNGRNKEGERNSFKNEETDRHILMQDTGLYDKNGKEIYEGDVLKRTLTLKQWERELFDEIIGEVAIEIGMTYLVGKCKHGYLDEELKISNYKALLLSPDLFEVIGDAHNNPELLESEGN